jgi:hypothetical protein
VNTEAFAGSYVVTSGAAIDMRTMPQRIRITPVVTLSRYTRRHTFRQYAYPGSAATSRGSATVSVIAGCVAIARFSCRPG